MPITTGVTGIKQNQSFMPKVIKQTVRRRRFQGLLPEKCAKVHKSALELCSHYTHFTKNGAKNGKIKNKFFVNSRIFYYNAGLQFSVNRKFFVNSRIFYYSAGLQFSVNRTKKLCFENTRGNKTGNMCVATTQKRAIKQKISV